MYLERLKLWNFRKYGSGNSLNRQPDLDVQFQKGVNLLVGENDSGKTAILDAIKLITLTRSNEYFRLQAEDFFHSTTNLYPTANLKIECWFAGLKDDEAKNFLEWLSIRKVDGNDEFYLRLTLDATLKGAVVLPYEVRAGADEEGSTLAAIARDLIRVTYLKPLRDAETELSPRRNSRLSQILGNHDAFKDKVTHPLMAVATEADTAIKNYFKGLDAQGNLIPDHPGKEINDTINRLLCDFFGNDRESGFGISTQTLKNILEKLELILEQGNSGLGSHNLLFIAAELLLLTGKDFTGLKLALVEEIEAHLHPQAQLRLIEFLSKDARANQVQLLITSHSPNLASKIATANVILCKDGWAYSMAPEHTELRVGDYAFLQRFLDATKANLFFAQGVILVEGDAENILIPVVARIIGRDLTKYGVSVVNIGNTAFNRYSRIFKRKDANKFLKIPVACITDNDINLDAGLTQQQIEQNRKNIAARYDGQHVKTFISLVKTMEYDLALGTFQKDLYLASLAAAKLKNSDEYGVTIDKYRQILATTTQQFTDWTVHGTANEVKARHIWKYIADNNLKAITAQYFASQLEHREKRGGIKAQLLADPYFRYIVEAIEYVTAPFTLIAPPKNPATQQLNQLQANPTQPNLTEHVQANN
ncbi:hypothetical protein A4D02_33590 [Niastella koreensis]|uniref:ATP-dependent OLD family endonuclease n=2 Tax=Niastella koreensis TaxID=354356 RepID=G8TAG3_NIAKG|nr:AAA family ATPase [Niastella koreensis]AEV98125.1 ATP-dependent OLD family endonuclease [Niastella koreensis GR20-10]OQP45333.1 hypothetical protein A4D02_33590 [Niastella koreensis]